jgi:hypothetical protein
VKKEGRNKMNLREILINWLETHPELSLHQDDISETDEVSEYPISRELSPPLPFRFWRWTLFTVPATRINTVVVTDCGCGTVEIEDIDYQTDLVQDLADNLRQKGIVVIVVQEKE